MSANRDDAAAVGRFRPAIVLFLLFAAVAGLVLYLLYREESDAYWAVARTDEERKVALGREVLNVGLGSVAADVLYLSEQGALRRWLASGDPTARAEMNTEYQAFAAYKIAYERLRFIDAEGREVVRIERDNDQPRVVPDDRLQEKVDRYYVPETLKLDRGQVYMSPFDLKAERGVVEEPPKPMIRFAAPALDADGRKRGLVVINFLGQRLLDRIKTLAAEQPGEIALLNGDGYWLLSPRPDEQWAFMYPDRKDRTFARAYPEAWEKISSGPASGQFVDDEGLFTYARVAPAATRQAGSPLSQVVPAEGSWILLATLPAATIAEATAARNWSFALAAAVLAALLAAVAWLIARHWAARRQSEIVLSRSEEGFRNLLESAPDAVIITNTEGRIVLANAQTEALFDYPRDQLVGQMVEMLIPERYRGRHVGHRQGYVATPRPRPMGAGLQLHGRRRDGTEFPVSISLSPAQAGDATLVFCDIRDISQQKAAEGRIEDLARRLARDNMALGTVNRELEAFSYSVSHDLRAPLRAIDGFSQALQEDSADRLDDAGRDHLRRVRNATQRMGRLIDDLLNLARVSRAEMRTAPTDLSAMVRQSLEDLQKAAPERQADVVISPGLRAQADPGLLRAALDNLLRNAWKFTGKRERARIEFGRLERDGKNIYYVKDNGAGFDMAYADKLFGAFQRLHDAGEFPGTGIGLATVQRIIHKHGGRVWAESEPDRGATFFFTLSEKGLEDVGEGDSAGRGQS